MMPRPTITRPSPSSSNWSQIIQSIASTRAISRERTTTWASRWPAVAIGTNAELCYRNAIKLQENLVKQSPLAGSYTRDLAISYNNLGMVQSRDSRYADAEASFQTALALQKRLLAAAEPNDAATLSNLGGVFNNLGLLFDRQRRFSAAETAYEQAVRFQRQAFESAPDHDRYRDLLSNHYSNYSKCLRSQAKEREADELAAEGKNLLAGQPVSAAPTRHN